MVEADESTRDFEAVATGTVRASFSSLVRARTNAAYSMKWLRKQKNKKKKKSEETNHTQKAIHKTHGTEVLHWTTDLPIHDVCLQWETVW